MNRYSLLAAALAAVFIMPASARAADATEALSQCLVENASPKDQASLVRWLFSGLSANPSLRAMSTLSPAERETINRAMVATFERLMLEDCRAEVVAAMKGDGEAAIRAGFEVMGRRAAEQLMSDPAASAELEKLSTYLDEAKWTTLGKEVEAAGGKLGK